MKINNFINKMLYLILFLLLLMIIYFTNILNVHEGFEKLKDFIIVKKDCSNCIVKPTSSSCITIKDISFSFENSLPVIKFGQEYTFCPWEEHCSYEPSLNQLYNNKGSTICGEIYDFSCCSGDTFYNDYTINYTDISFVKQNIDKCSTIITNPQLQFPGITDITQFYNICRDENNNRNIYKEKKGLLFKKINDSYTSYAEKLILKDTTYKQLKEIIRVYYPDLFIYYKNKANLQQLDTSFNRYIQISKKFSDYKSERLNKLVYGNTSNIGTTTFNDYDTIKQLIIDMEKDMNRTVREIGLHDLSWQLQTKTLENTSNMYLLNPGQFLSCSGQIYDVRTSETSPFAVGNTMDKFGDTDLEIFDNSQLMFGSGDKNIKTTGDYANLDLSAQMNLDVAFNRLENIPNTSTMVPVSIINQYLNQINNFYNRQLNNMLGVATHSQQPRLQFIDNKLDIEKTSFFTYDNCNNEVYNTFPSITGDHLFNYKGPTPYEDIDRITSIK